MSKAKLFTYVSLHDDEAIAIYEVNVATGQLAQRGHCQLHSSPSVLTANAAGNILYVAMRTSGNITTCHIDTETGALTPIGTVETGLEDPSYLTIDHTGRFVITPYYISGKVTVYPIREDGALQGPPSAVHKTGLHAHGVAIDKSNKFAFVPHTCPTNAIFQFHFDSESGTLAPNAAPRIEAPTKTGPRHLIFRPDSRFAYADNEQGSSVTTYRFDEENGTLEAVQTLSTLPEEYDGGNACARLEIHPSGRFLYAANRGHDSIAGFAIDAATGALTALGQFTAAKTPRGFGIDPSGRLLVAAGQSADRLLAYRIDAETGSLEMLEKYETGAAPWWVTLVAVGF